MASGPRRRQPASGPEAARRIIAASPETWHALEALSRDEGLSLHSLAEEAFRDLLKKHRRPRSLLEALKQSARQYPANDHDAAHVKRAR